jgi:tetratricopeptide (TPR) repeat protein
MTSNLSGTQPTRPTKRTAPGTQPNKPSKPAGRLRGWLRSPLLIALLSIFVALLLVGGASAAVGWDSGRERLHATATVEAGLYMLDQYNLALEDIDAGRYDLAKQRLEFIYYADPDFLDVKAQLVNVLFIMSSTVQPTTAPVVGPTATPTTDPRPKEELFIAAQAAFAAQDWSTTIDTLLSLRKADAGFRTADVDGMLFASLRNRGAANITQLGLFEPGLYDFALAEKFGPLDGQALQYREWARLYLYGNAFWLAYPEDAIYYYGQLVGMAPDLRDSTGLSAFYRYRQSLIHWGDKLAAAGDWCGAAEKYQDAQDARSDGELQPTLSNASFQCVGPEDTATNTAIFTPTRTNTGVPLPTNTLSASNTPGPTDTSAPVPTDTPEPPTDTPEPPTDTPLPTETPTETPTTT